MKLLSALSVYTVFGLQVFLVISKINMEFLNPLYRKTLEKLTKGKLFITIQLTNFINSEPGYFIGETS